MSVGYFASSSGILGVVGEDVYQSLFIRFGLIACAESGGVSVHKTGQVGIESVVNIKINRVMNALISRQIFRRRQAYQACQACQA